MTDITGTAGNDTLTGTSGDDLIQGLDGHDRLQGAGGNDVVLGGDGDDQLEGGVGDDRLEGGAGADYILGGAGHDTIIGGDGNDIIYSSEGSDIIEMGGGNNYADLGYGSLVVYNVQLTAGDGRDDVRLFSYGGSSFTMDLGGGNDRVWIEILGGSATLTLGAGADTISLGWYYPGPPNQASNGVVTITDFETGAGGDTLDFLAGLTIALTNWNHALNPFGTGPGSGHLRLVQQGADSVLQIDRNGGADSFVTFMIFKNRNVADFTPGNLDGFPTDGTIPAGLSIVGTDASDVITGWAGDDSLSGGGLQDSIYGGAGSDRLDGGDGADQLYGELGDDLLNGGNDGDWLEGGRGDDTLNGDAGDDNLYSDHGNDTLDGGAGADGLSFHEVSAGTGRGGIGDDRISLYSTRAGGLFALDGGDGADRIEIQVVHGRVDVTLGAGADVLALGNGAPAALLANGNVVISDFETGAGGDSVEIKLLLTALNAGWDGSANPFGSGHARLVASGGDTLLQIDANGGGDSWQTAVTFTGRAVASFTSANFDGYPPDGSPPPGVVLVGTQGIDNLRGGAGADSIDGLGGNDYLVGGAGVDTIRGGDDNDSIYGEGGSDLLEGGAGNDWLDDGTGNDVVRGEAGNDTFWNGAGSDDLDGGDGDDSFTVQRSGSHADTVTIRGGTGNDTAGLFLYGPSLYRADMGEGNDRIDLYTSAVTIEMTLGAGADVVSLSGVNWISGLFLSISDFAAGPGGDRLDLDRYMSQVLSGWNQSNPFTTGHARLFKSGADMLFQVDRDGGGDGYSTVVTLKNVGPTGFTIDNFGWAPTVVTGETRTGGIGNDTLVTGDGDDTLDGGAGADTMWGGRGDDIYFVDNAGDSVREFSGEGSDEIRTSLATYSLAALLNVEKLTATSDVAHDFRGNAGNNALTGGAGNDILRLQDGGNDTALGGAGNDGILFGAALSAGDVVDGGEGTRDQLGLQGNYGTFGAGAAAFTLGANHLVNIEMLVLLSGADSRFGDTSGNSYSYNIATRDVNVAAGQQLVVSFNSLRVGENVTFDGSAETDGSFMTYGGLGTDILIGGQQSDAFYFGADGRFGAGDRVDGRGGSLDQLGLQGDYSGARAVTFASDSMTGIEMIVLLSAGDSRFGGGSGDGFSYDIVMNDSNVAAGARMYISANALRSDGTLTEILDFDGSAEKDGFFTVYAGAGADILVGGERADEIWGRGGADRITGGLGADVLRGGEGDDVFDYNSAAESTAASRDSILDFTSGSDRIDLSGIDADSLAGGDQAFSWIGSNAFSGNGAAGQLRVYQDGASGAWIVEGDVNGDGIADFQIAVAGTSGSLASSDFIV